MIELIREKVAYSFIGKQACKVLRTMKYKNSRVQWIQQAVADWNFSKLTK